MSRLKFTAEEIHKLFGHEAAEDEDPDRLREYYFKGATYKEAVADLPLRILVGHKGIGKSALFRMALREDIENSRIAVIIRPDDVDMLGTEAGDALKMIRSWKEGLLDIITSKILTSLGMDRVDKLSRVKDFGGRLGDFLQATFTDTKGIDLAPTKKLIVEQYLKSGAVTVYVDDLDRFWEGRRQDVKRISALFNAVRDIARDNPKIRFRISLRTDVYYMVRTSDESTDKIEGSVVWHTWTNHEILKLLVKRIETFFGRQVEDAELRAMSDGKLLQCLKPVMETRYTESGHWHNWQIHDFLRSLIRKRPRDLVKLCSLAAREACSTGSCIISSRNFESILGTYSRDRIQDTFNEFRSELPDIERLLWNMKRARRDRGRTEDFHFGKAALMQKINKIMRTGEFRFSSNVKATARDLHHFMYKINFLIAIHKSSSGKASRYYFEENRFLSNDLVDFGYTWEIHPAYRGALRSARDIPRATMKT